MYKSTMGASKMTDIHCSTVKPQEDYISPLRKWAMPNVTAPR